MEKRLSAREIALMILYKIEKQKAYVNLELKKQLQNSKLSGTDKALVTELVNGVIKHKLTLDYIINAFSKIKQNKISLKILIILRLGIYQIMYLDKIPDSASCNESVKLAHKYGHSASAGYVNAVLRNIIRNKDTIMFPDKNKKPEEFLSTYYSYPEWLIKKWINDYGYDFTEELCKAGNERPNTCIRVNTLKITPDELIEKLKTKGLQVVQGRYLKECLYINNTGDLVSLDLYKEGLFQVQDESSMMVSRILNPLPGDTVIDVCCGPGGKITHIAELMKNDGIVIGWDIHPHKIKLVNSVAQRLGVKNIELEVQDAEKKVEKYNNKADKVLVDAPCTGFGIIRRKPDIKWNRKFEDIAEMARIQINILNTISNYIKPGGILVYSTCTFGDEENIDTINKFLKHNQDFKLMNIEDYIPKKLDIPTVKEGYIQLFPNVNNTDGFFICKMKRVK